MRVVPGSQHQPIGDDLDCQSGIDALSATQYQLTNLQDGLESTSELLDAMMLMPDGQYLTCSQLPTASSRGDKATHPFLIDFSAESVTLSVFRNNGVR